MNEGVRAPCLIIALKHCSINVSVKNIEIEQQQCRCQGCQLSHNSNKTHANLSIQSEFKISELVAEVITDSDTECINKTIFKEP